MDTENTIQSCWTKSNEITGKLEIVEIWVFEQNIKTLGNDMQFMGRINRKEKNEPYVEKTLGERGRRKHRKMRVESLNS